MKLQAISGTICLVQNIRYPNIAYTIYRVQNTHEISRYLGDHLSGAGNWRSQEANGGPLPQASRTKPSFVGFPDSSQTYLLAFCNAVLSLTTDTSSTFLNYCYIWLFFAVKPNSVPSGFCVQFNIVTIFSLCFHFHPH